MPSYHRSHPLAALSLLGACMSSPTTFVLNQPQRLAKYETYVVRFTPIPDDPEMDPGLKADFEAGLKAGIASAKNLRGVTGAEATEGTLELRYRAAGIAGGSLPMRAGSTAVNAFLPFGVVPEIGGGALGVETTFFDRQGTVVGRILVQGEVHGLLNSDGHTMRSIGSQTGDYAAKRFTAPAAGAQPAATVPDDQGVINLCPEKARAELKALEPFIGVWDMQYEIEVTGRPPIHARVIEISRWEAGGRIFFQFAETQDTEEKLFRCNTVLWDPVARRLKVYAIDSTFGAHESNQVTFEISGNTMRGACTEKERVTEVVETFAPDGRSRTGTKTVWNADRSRLLLRIHSEGKKREGGLIGP